MRINDFSHGYGSVLNIFPTDDTAKITIPHESDEDALRNDWEMVGNDLSTAINASKNDLPPEIGEGIKK